METSPSFLRPLTMAAMVYKYGLMAELMGSTKVTDHAKTDGGRVRTLAWTRIPKRIIGNQQAKSVMTIAATLAVIRSCSFISLLSPARFEDL